MVEVVDEQRLVRASQQGDHEAFENLVRQHQRMIHSLTYRMTGSWSDAQDLAQETFLHAFRQLPNFRGDAKFSSWLYRIAVNQCLNWKKRAAHQTRLGQQWQDEQLEPGTPDNEDAAHEVQQALLKLKPNQRAAIVLTTYDGLNHAEAARLIGCSETTVSWYLFTARSKLKTLLRHLKTTIGGVS